MTLASQQAIRQGIDVSVANHGSLFLLYPQTEDALYWVALNLPEDVLHAGRAIVVEPRYVADIVAGLQADGLVVR